MRVARTIASFLTAMALALAMVLQATPTPAVAVTGYDSAFLFESDWLIVKPGESGQAAVTFLNVGSVSWQKGGASQVNLATCCPLNSPPTHAAWAVTWLSSTAYATHREDLVAPGGRGTYIWNFKAPDTAAVGIYDFPGDLVLAATGEAIHREGYFHRNDLRTAAPTVTPDRLTLTPEFTSQQIGQNVTLSALVEGAAGTDGTRPKVADAEVTFVVDAGATDTGNSDFSRTAVTNASGVATITYTRNNPGTDKISAFVTTKPTVRDDSTVSWTIAANPITVTPDDSVTLANSACRTYTVASVHPDTGKAGSKSQLRANFFENFSPDATADRDGGSTIDGEAVSNTSSREITLDSGGRATLNVCGGADKKVTVIVFDESGGTSGGPTTEGLDTGDLRDTGGSITFTTPSYTVTVTPDTSEDTDTPSQRVFTVEIKDQAGNPASGRNVDIGFIELLDLDTGNNPDQTASGIRISWVDNTDPFTTSRQRDCTVLPGSGATAPSISQFRHELTTNAQGKFTFAICSNVNTGPAAPVVWVDDIPGGPADNDVRETAEAFDTGGATKWVTASVGGGRFRSEASNTDEFNGTSAAIGGVDGSATDVGEEVLTFTALNRNGGNFTGGVQTVTFTVTNNGTKVMCVQAVSGAESPAVGTDADCGGTGTAIQAGGSLTFTTTTTAGGGFGAELRAGVQQATITLDSDKVTKASITAQVVGVDASKVTATKEWLSAGPAEPAALSTAPYTVSGSVIAKSTGSTTSDGGNYTIKTSASEIITISYDINDVLQVAGTNVSEATFEDKLSVGDSITFTNDTRDPNPDEDTHNITTDVP